MSRIATRRPPIWLAAYLLVLLIWLLGLYLPLFFGGFPGLIDSLDFSYYYAAARIGLEHGWSHIYDLQLQQQVFAQLHPYDVFDWRRYFVSPPPVAWLVAPLTLLPLAPAFWIFAGISATAFAATGWLVTPGRGIARLALFLTVACTYPVLIAIQTGQVTPLIAAATVFAWWLASRGRDVIAGLVLVLVVLKPQVAILVPVALLIAGRRRLFVTWLVGAGALALLVSYRHRHNGLEVVVVAAILGTLLLSPYHNPSDFAILAPAALLYFRSGVPAWQWVWFAAGLLGTYIAAGSGPGLLLVFTLGWLGLLVVGSLQKPRAEASHITRVEPAAVSP
ncbi:MAG TPA: glycosyltransferase family 87 protein [Candidatus Dormibacteraeota bacterium]